MKDMFELLNEAWKNDVNIIIRPRVDDGIVDIEFDYTAGEDQYRNRIISIDLADPKSKYKDHIIEYMFNVIEMIKVCKSR